VTVSKRNKKMLSQQFECHYDLDQSPDKELANLYQESYRFIRTAIGDTYNVHLDPDGFPDAVQWYLLYAAALIHGAADASLVLTLHCLGREARFIGRQLFEYWIRAAFYANNPTEAKALLLSTPFVERQILDELGYDKELNRYKQLEKDCGEISTRFPGFTVHQEPKLRRLVGDKDDPVATKLYAFLYRIPSQTMHASGGGIGTVMREEGVAFDSRETNPNIGLHTETWLVIQFLALINDKLDLGVSGKLGELKGRLDAIHARLGDDFGPAPSRS
jgi:hypothetical protein